MNVDLTELIKVIDKNGFVDDSKVDTLLLEYCEGRIGMDEVEKQIEKSIKKGFTEILKELICSKCEHYNRFYQCETLNKEIEYKDFINCNT